MCGRFTLASSADTIAEVFDLDSPVDIESRYNIAPSQAVLAVTANGCRRASYFRWGLVPFWAKDPKIGYRLINARAETVAEKPAFRDAFRQRRCLIAADGFYEWQSQRHGNKQPFYFYQSTGASTTALEHRQPFGFAGLWDEWHGSQGEYIASCTILTGDANEIVKPVHHRMPIIIPQTDYAQWLDGSQPVANLQELLRGSRGKTLTKHPVNAVVNNPKHDQRECIDPAEGMAS